MKAALTVPLLTRFEEIQKKGVTAHHLSKPTVALLHSMELAACSFFAFTWGWWLKQNELVKCSVFPFCAVVPPACAAGLVRQGV